MTDPAIRNLIAVLLADQRTRTAGGIERLLKNLSTEQGRESWREWRANPVTVTFLDALRALAEAQLHGHDGNKLTDLALAYGAMSGVGLAARLIDDPRRVFPSIFDGEEALAKRGAAIDHVMMPGESYSTPEVEL